MPKDALGLHPVHVAELEAILAADIRLPSRESRKRWAKARDLSYPAVNIYFRIARMEAKRDGLPGMDGTYDLPVGEPPEVPPMPPPAPLRRTRARKATRNSNRLNVTHAPSSPTTSRPSSPFFDHESSTSFTPPSSPAPDDSAHTPKLRAYSHDEEDDMDPIPSRLHLSESENDWRATEEPDTGKVVCNCSLFRVPKDFSSLPKASQSQDYDAETEKIVSLYPSSYFPPADPECIRCVCCVHGIRYQTPFELCALTFEAGRRHIEYEVTEKPLDWSAPFALDGILYASDGSRIGAYDVAKDPLTKAHDITAFFDKPIDTAAGLDDLCSATA